MRKSWPPGEGRRYLFAGIVTVLALLAALAIRQLTGSAPALLLTFFPALLAVTFYSGPIAAVVSWLFAVSAGAFAWSGSVWAPPVLPVEDRWALAAFALSTAVSIAISAIARRAALEERTQLLRAEQKAQQDVGLAVEDKQRALSKLSHDLRTPLSTIIGWAQVLRAQNPPEQMLHGLEVIERNARAQTRIIQELLDQSPADNDGAAAEPGRAVAQAPNANASGSAAPGVDQAAAGRSPSAAGTNQSSVMVGGKPLARVMPHRANASASAPEADAPPGSQKDATGPR